MLLKSNSLAIGLEVEVSLSSDAQRKVVLAGPPSSQRGEDAAMRNDQHKEIVVEHGVRGLPVFVSPAEPVGVVVDVAHYADVKPPYRVRKETRQAAGRAYAVADGPPLLRRETVEAIRRVEE